MEEDNVIFNVRAYLADEKKFYYPERNTYGSLAVFYGVIQGFQNLKKDFSISMGSTIKDINGTLIYEGDVIKVNTEDLIDNAPFIIQKSGTEYGRVVFEEACFLIVNSEGMEYELGLCEDAPDMTIEIIGNIYEDDFANI